MKSQNRLEELGKKMAQVQDPSPTAVHLEPAVLDHVLQEHVYEVKQLVRTIGITTTPESQSVGSVNERLAELLNEGWTIHTAQALGAGVGGAVTIYYLLIR